MSAVKVVVHEGDSSYEYDIPDGSTLHWADDGLSIRLPCEQHPTVTTNDPAFTYSLPA